MKIEISPPELNQSLTAPMQSQAVSSDVVFLPRGELFFDELSGKQTVVEPATGPQQVFTIIDGELVRLLRASPPGTIPLRPNSGLFRIVAVPNGSR